MSSGRGSPSMLYSTFGVFPRSARAIACTSSGVMCRRSARGWTVIPGVPAATQTSTASSTLGASPPRELRSVATLFTLTERRIMISSQRSAICNQQFAVCNPLARVFLDRLDDFLRPGADLVFVAPFDHHAEQRLGARVPHEQPPLAGDPRF